MKRVAGGGFRLIDGVIVAAVALLALKTLGIFAGSTQPDAMAASDTPFARVLTHARTNFEPADPTTTGSTGHGGGGGHGGEAAPAAAPPPAPMSGIPVPAFTQDPSKAETPPTERLILDRLGARRDELQQRTREMEERQKLIDDQERKLDERLNKLQAAEDAKRASGSKSEQEANAGLKNLVTMYETMKPKDAARVFERLPQEVLVSVVTQMNSRKMSEVLAAMSPESAEKLTVALAKRAGPGNGGERSASAGLPAGELPGIDPPTRAGPRPPPN